MTAHELSEVSSMIGVLSVIVFAIAFLVFISGDERGAPLARGIGGVLMAAAASTFAFSGWMFASIREWEGAETGAYLIYLLAGYTTLGALMLMTGLVAEKGAAIGSWILASATLMWIPVCLIGAV
ncbi:hypothetical protein ACX27O_15470 [Micromonospora sp. SD19]